MIGSQNLRQMCEIRPETKINDLILVKVFKNGPIKIFGRHPLKTLK